MQRTLLALSIVALSATTAISATAEDNPKTRATAGGTLHLDTRMSHGWVKIGEPTTVFASISIRGQAAESDERVPLNIALVVDRSTSMSGGKLEQAKKASHMLVDMLGAQDRLAIVSYGSDVTTESESLLATAANKELLHNAVDRIQLSGSTNLSGGYERGRDLVMKNNRDETINRVLLLSDGHANVGTTGAAELGLLARGGLDRGVSLTTMGIGLDYNEELMTRMATEGAGNYYFIEKEEAIAAMFEKECKGLASTVARNTVLTLEMAPGVELLELHGFAHRTKGNVTTVKLAEFFGNQQKDILARVAVSPQAAGKTPVMTAKLRFDDVLQDDKRVSSSATLVAVATKDVAKVKDVDRDVVRRAQQVQTAEAMQAAMDEFERGERDKAAKIIADQRAANKGFVTEYDFDDDVSFDRVDGELRELEQSVQKTEVHSKEGKRVRKAKRARAYEINSAQSLW